MVFYSKFFKYSLKVNKTKTKTKKQTKKKQTNKKCQNEITEFESHHHIHETRDNYG